MSPSHGEVKHVSDTALMVAACRALEFEDPEGFVKDPFAERLAGDRGMAILQEVPNREMMRLVIGVRSRFVDEVLLEALAEHAVATVLSVGCGLDSRPWRLDLRPDLRWIEADFAHLLDYKDGLMSQEKPRCLRERMVVDVNDAEQRRALYQAAGAGPALMITEGLLTYLPAATVEALTAEAGRENSVAHWIIDPVSSVLRRGSGMDTVRAVTSMQAPDSLDGEQIVDCLHRHGWVSVTRRSYMTDMGFAMERIGRRMGQTARREPPPDLRPDDPSGVHRFVRASALP